MSSCATWPPFYGHMVMPGSPPMTWDTPARFEEWIYLGAFPVPVQPMRREHVMSTSVPNVPQGPASSCRW